MGLGFFSIMEFLFPIMFLFVFGMFIAIFIRSFRNERKNDRSPRLTVPVTVVGRRQHRSSGTREHSGHTSYYITFEVASGDRMELPIPATDFGYIVEGDRGDLTFQGTRFISFQRT